jgi:chromosome segregation ATPase
MSLTKKDLGELVKTIQADYAAINSKVTKLDSLAKDVADLKKLLADSEAKNAELRAQLGDTDVEVHPLKRQLNSVEQHNRS